MCPESKQNLHMLHYISHTENTFFFYFEKRRGSDRVMCGKGVLKKFPQEENKAFCLLCGKSQPYHMTLTATKLSQ